MQPPPAQLREELKAVLAGLPPLGALPPGWLTGGAQLGGFACRHPSETGLIVISSSGVVAVGTERDLHNRDPRVATFYDQHRVLESLLAAWIGADPEQAARLCEL